MDSSQSSSNASNNIPNDSSNDEPLSKRPRLTAEMGTQTDVLEQTPTQSNTFPLNDQLDSIPIVNTPDELVSIKLNYINPINLAWRSID